MTTVAQSPSPNKKTLYLPRPYLGMRQIVWGYLITDGEQSRYVDWAAKTEQMEQTVRCNWQWGDHEPAAFQYFMPYADTLALVAEEPEERERDDDESLFAGQNYGYMAENGEY